MKQNNLLLTVVLFLSTISSALYSQVNQVKNKEVVINFFNETYNKKNLQYVRDFFAKNYFEHRDDGARTNLDAIRIIKSAEGIFPDLTVKIEDVVVEDNLVAIRLTFKGTHKGTYLGVEPTNKSISWEAMEFFKLENGIITESWGSWPNYDIVSMLKK